VRRIRADKLEQRIPLEKIPLALALRDMTRITSILAAGSAGLMAVDSRYDAALDGWLEWACSIALCSFALLAFQLGRLGLIWLGQTPDPALNTKRANATRKNMQQRGFIELFGYFCLSVSALTLIAYLSTVPGWLGANTVRLAMSSPGGDPDPLHVAVFLLAFFLCFLPLIVGFVLTATDEVRRRSLALFRDDAVSPMTLLIASVSIASVVSLAWAAEGQLFSMSRDFGVIVTLLVICGFLVTILAPHVARQWNEHTEERQEYVRNGVQKAAIPFGAPAKFVSWIDSALVRLIAPLSGATQRGPGVPHILLIAVMMPLCALGFVLASPYGLIPIAVGMLIALSLGRRWAWVEEDRETASRLKSTLGSEIQIGFENDLKDEALLGYASFFILVPLALNQLQDWTGSFNVIEQASSGNAFLDWLRFFGAELAKAVPFVDWWEIYNVKVDTPFDAENAAPLAKHLTFAARALVDLVIMSALLQVFGMWQRARTQHKLYDSGQLDSFDPFTETAFFETGMLSSHAPMPKQAFTDRIKKHLDHQKHLGLDVIPYSQRRLNELIASENRDVRAGAEWMVAHYELLAGPPRAQLQQLRFRWVNLRYRQGGQLWTTEGTATVRAQKFELERILHALGEDTSQLDDDLVGIMLGILEETRGAPEFSFSQVLSHELFGLMQTRFAVLALALHVLDGEHFNARPEWREDLTTQMGFRLPALFQGGAEMRTRIYSALQSIGCNPMAEMAARKCALELLDWLGNDPRGDRATYAKTHASKCAATVHECMNA
jgi:hypothetical protein